jgi:hypothetical protein
MILQVEEIMKQCGGLVAAGRVAPIRGCCVHAGTIQI